jgi:hypothetical protein
VERDVALEVNGIAQVTPGGEQDGSAAHGCGCVDGLVDGSGIEGLAVAGGVEGFDVVRAGIQAGGGMGEGGACDERAGALKEVPAESGRHGRFSEYHSGASV